ncbi:hypothetical protein SELMODRAFT_448832 [Selaginella moellendorffii]|uniref:Uncharacterized protein n=1 Tax=Selaginella moellendorffii TaxID=88036 RepID=D8TAI8_SELML|nr:uncharacterized protein LOC9629737 [Selaginella moellendorffii]EFJ06326.1 hypothetical protein SELMODRAFT_448832 [Selaginella moellendorffii]|eukprot:XP_002992624.1 uncharacterized protein LOC9629737 [Selaginella moellendorffii]
MEAVPVRRTRSQARKEQQQEEEVILAVDLQIDPIAAEEHAKLGWRRCGVPGKRRTAVPRRRPLADVTNDSPIAGMCKGSPAAAMAIAKNKSAAVVLEEEEEAGESLLRSQVQSLLETVDPCKVTSFVYSSPCSDHGGPTPANTPAGGATAAAGGMITIAIHDPAEEEDDQSSNWSVDVNVSSPQKSVEEEEEEPVIQKNGKANPSCPNPWAMRDHTSKLVDPEFEDEGAIDQNPGAEKEEEFDEEEEEDEVVDDELCRGVSGICVSKKPLFVQFAGKHIRYKYNSDDELLEEEVIDPPSPPPVAEPSPSITKLNGVPIAAGKHLRFQDP